MALYSKPWRKLFRQSPRENQLTCILLHRENHHGRNLTKNSYQGTIRRNSSLYSYIDLFFKNA